MKKKIKNANKRYLTNLAIVLIVILAISFIASSTYFRPYPTHNIVKRVNCFSCHATEFDDLNKGIHIRAMNNTQTRFLEDYVDLYGNTSDAYRTLEGPCYSCHITYQNFDLFGLTDPYVYVVGNVAGNDVVNAQYGNIITWPSGNMAVEYFDTGNVGNVAVTVELEVMDVIPSNSAIESTIKVTFANYTGQQNGSNTCDCSQTLYAGDTQVLAISNIANDYFSITLILDGSWNSSFLNLRVIGTDQGTESYFINAVNPMVVYSIPNDVDDKTYFKTGGTYKAVRLDYVWTEWSNYTIGNIASSEDIQTNSTAGMTTANTCSAPDAWCHINQKTTYIGLNNGLNTNRSFYNHYMASIIPKQCRLCHMRSKYIMKI